MRWSGHAGNPRIVRGSSSPRIMNIPLIYFKFFSMVSCRGGIWQTFVFINGFSAGRCSSARSGLGIIN